VRSIDVNGADEKFLVLGGRTNNNLGEVGELNCICSMIYLQMAFYMGNAEPPNIHHLKHQLRRGSYQQEIKGNKLF
jgi:hypothetical protein